jgi:hypothetical protein
VSKAAAARSAACSPSDRKTCSPATAAATHHPPTARSPRPSPNVDSLPLSRTPIRKDGGDAEGSQEAQAFVAWDASDLIPADMARREGVWVIRKGRLLEPAA